MNAKTTASVIVSVILVAIGAVTAFVAPKPAQDADLGHGGSLASVWTNMIGTSASPSTLSSSYNGASSTSVVASGLPHVAFVGHYTPSSYGSGLFLMLERSLDRGATWAPYNVINPTSAGTLVYTSGSSTTSGAPFIVPGEGQGVAVSGTRIDFSFDLPIVADFIRVSAKEQSTSTAGTLNLQAMFQTN